MSTRTSSAKFCAFIDLVGTRERARFSTDKYLESLDMFQRRVAQVALDLSKENDPAIYIFSDSAFLEARSQRSLIAFLQRLRTLLLADGLYFKGAIASGGIDPSPAASALGRLISATRTKQLEKSLHGTHFSENAAKLYVAQELLKGIGFTVHELFAPSANVESSSFVWSCFLPEFGSRKATAFLDLRLAREDLVEVNAERIIRDAFSSKTRSKKFGRFYVSLLVTWVQSLELSEQSFEAPDRIIEASLSGELERMLGDVLGIELVYVAILGRVFASRDAMNLSLRRDIKRKLLRVRRIGRSLEYVPEKVLSLDARESLVEDLSRVLRAWDYSESDATARAKELDRIGISGREIARRLSREGFRKAGNQQWSEREVAAWLAE